MNLNSTCMIDILFEPKICQWYNKCYWYFYFFNW